MMSNISRGRAVTDSSCGGTFNDNYITNVRVLYCQVS